MTDDPTVLSKLVRLAKQAGAASEDDYERDGAFSFHAETHAAGIGFGVGAAATATNDYRYVAALLAIAFGANRGPELSSTQVLNDCRQEPHYLLFGLAIGLALGALISR